MSYKFSLHCLKSSLLALFLLLLQPGFSQSNFQELDQEWQARQKMLGKDAVIMLANKDTVIYKKEAGDFNSKTVAPIASCSKWLTAALVMMFVDEGKLSLDDKITKWLPIYEKYGKGYITIRHCLSHMTGIESEPITILKLLQRRKFNSLEEEVNSFCEKEI